MLEAELTGVQSAIANLTERGAVDPVVKATVTLSDSGFIAVKDAIAYGEVKDDSLTGKSPPQSSTSHVDERGVGREIEESLWCRFGLVFGGSIDRGRRRDRNRCVCFPERDRDWHDAARDDPAEHHNEVPCACADVGGRKEEGTIKVGSRARRCGCTRRLTRS